MNFTYDDLFWASTALLIFALLFRPVRDAFFTQMHTYTYGFSFTDQAGSKVYSEVVTQSAGAPKEISFFQLCQQAVRGNGSPNYVYHSDPNFQLSYAMHLTSCWRRTSVLLKAQEKKRQESEKREPQLAADSTEAA